MPKVPGALEVMPPPPVGPDEDRTTLKPLIARSRALNVGPMVDFAAYRAGPDDPVQIDFDEEPTLTAPVVPGLVSKDGERPTDLSSVIAGDFQLSGRDVGLILVVVDSEPRRREPHGWHGAPPRAARLSAQKYLEVMGRHKDGFEPNQQHQPQSVLARYATWRFLTCPIRPPGCTPSAASFAHPLVSSWFAVLAGTVMSLGLWERLRNRGPCTTPAGQSRDGRTSGAKVAA
jgi:hypothetical protein